MKATVKHSITRALLALTMIGCTEERPYDEVFKGDLELQAKSELCSGEDEYLYVPSTVEVSRTTGATRPHWMGDAKHVKLVCGETTLKVVEVDVTNDFSDNPTNLRPVLEIPIEHVDYKCGENADGKCSQKEVQNDDISWKDKRYVDVQPERLRVQEVNFLPVQLTSLFMPSCLSPQSESLIESEISPEAINITIEKSFKAGLGCAGPIRELSDLGFRVQYHYSIVKLDSIADPNYKPLTYTQADETTFGYFDTKSNKLDVDHNEIESGDHAFVNRWNPNKTITYHMNSNFLKPENQSLIKATKDAVTKINQGLKSVGANMQIELLDPDPTGKLMTGDLRVNSIVLVDDPLAMNVIGYGPSVANKRTGEILHARTVMYLGTIRKFVKYTYEDFVQKKMADLAALKQTQEAEKKAGQQVVSLSPQLLITADRHKSALHATHEHAVKVAGSEEILGRSLAGNQIHGPFLPVKADLLKDRALNESANVYSRLNDMQSEEEQIEFLMHKNCFFTSDMLAPDAGLDEKIEELIAKLGLKLWGELTKEEKEEALSVLTPYVWTPVLVHEFGHNLGLRHNFNGSEDKDNYYTKDELIDLGITHPISYSSVMDYTYNTINELPVLGKYDLAALRFGYAEAVEMKDGSIKSLVDFRSEGGELKPYKYCTDEHVALNPTCNRFDEGSDLLEITQHLVKAHQEGYSRYNFRNGRKDFSLFDDLSHAYRLNRTLGGLRLVFERYESIKNTFGLADDNPIWETDNPNLKFLVDLKKSVKLAAEYLTSVITTPDLMCAVAQASNPFQIVGLAPLSMLSTSAASCYDQENLQLNPQFVVVGHSGKLFQSKKDPRNANPYIDQIDVRGIWIDKLVALDVLTGRKQNVLSFDKFRDNFLDISDVAEGIDDVLRAVTSNQVVAPITIHTVFGQSLTVEFPVSMYDASEQQNGHRIMDPLSTRVTQMFGLPSGNPSFQKVVINKLKESLESETQANDPSSLLNALESFVVGIGITPPAQAQGYINTAIGTRIYAAPLSSSLAAQSIALFEASKVMERMGEDLIKKVIADIEAGKGPSEKASELEKVAHQLGKPLLEAFINGIIQPSKFYAELVKTMAS